MQGRHNRAGEVTVHNHGAALMLLMALQSYIKTHGAENRQKIQAWRDAGEHDKAEYFGMTAARGMGFVVEIYNAIAAQCGEDAIAL